MFVSILSSGKTQPQREVIDLHAVFFAFFCLFGLVWFIVYSFSFLFLLRQHLVYLRLYFYWSCSQG